MLPGLLMQTEVHSKTAPSKRITELETLSNEQWWIVSFDSPLQLITGPAAFVNDTSSTTRQSVPGAHSGWSNPATALTQSDAKWMGEERMWKNKDLWRWRGTLKKIGEKDLTKWDEKTERRT
jgi:hypothetical protein